MSKVDREIHLEKPLLEWLERRRRIRSDTILVRELPWFGRRVDLVTLTTSGTVTAYELKLRDNKGALRQASYNRLAFDRSYVVTASIPSAKIQQRAKKAGIGIIVAAGNDHTVICKASEGPENVSLRQRLVGKVRQKVQSNV